MSDATQTAAPLPVAICVVTHNDAEDLADFFASLRRLRYEPLELIVVDCASHDASVSEARRLWPDGLAGELLAQAENLGFAGGMNVAFSATKAPLLLTLNADARPEPDFIDQLVGALATEPPAPFRAPGSATGRLTRFETKDEHPVLDACGMRLTTTFRHLDRGSGELDQGQYLEPAWVFGGTGAATLFSREALEDVAFPQAESPMATPLLEIFSEAFHSFREDAELAFRLQARGWACRYVPSARAKHRRSNTPQRRSQMPDFVNYHSLKNRYLLRGYHQTKQNFLKTFVPTLLRDVLALGYVVLKEHSSLGVYRWLWHHRRDILERRRWLASRRRVSSRKLDRWFFEDEWTH